MHRSPWPAPAARGDDGVLHVGGVAVTTLAAEHGTPLWVVDETDLRQRCQAYRDAFPGVWVAYASKAWCTTGVLQIVAGEGLWIDVASGGELHTARHAGVPMDRVVFHGNNKSVTELEEAVGLGVARIVVDSLDELDRLGRVARAADRTVRVWLRVTPGIDAHTHEFVRTGQDDSKFGFTLSLGLADEALATALGTDGVEVVGVHAHIGSQIFGTDPFVANAEVLVETLARWRSEHGVTLGEVNLGGGMGIRYTHEDHPVRTTRYGEAVLRSVEDACEDHDYPVPQLAVEPGRAIVGPSTVTVYEVGTVKRLPGIRTYVSVDGGMSDNIRPALYEAEHEVQLASRESTRPPTPTSVVGKHCESGDLVAEHARLPEDVAAGDLLAVAATGAYTEAMASNYNRVPRPAAVLVRDGEVRPLVRRETYADVVARDVPLTRPSDPGTAVWIAIVALLGGCVAVTLVGRRGAAGELPRNHLAGLRTSATLADDDAWRVGNAVAGPYGVVGGVAGAVATLGCGAIALAGASEPVVAVALLLTAALLLGIIVVGAVRGHRAARDHLDGRDC